MGFTETELSLLYVGDEEMARLNSEYRQVEGPTDVLSFPMHEGDFGEVSPEVLGDVVISVETADAMATRYGCPFEAVLDLLLIHGVLHLAGYDHEEGEEEARAMEAETRRLLTVLGHPETLLDRYLQQ